MPSSLFFTRAEGLLLMKAHIFSKVEILDFWAAKERGTTGSYGAHQGPSFPAQQRPCTPASTLQRKGAPAPCSDAETEAPGGQVSGHRAEE